MLAVLIVLWALILIEWVIIARSLYRSKRRWQEHECEWLNSPHQIPQRDLRQEYRQ